MADTLYEQKLAEFKAQEKPEVVLLLGDDAELVRITVAWANMTTSPAKKLSPPPAEDHANAWWAWLWDNTTCSRQELMDKAYQAGQGLDQKLKALIGNRILYPDATVNSFAQRYLRERVLKLFQAKPPAPPRKTAAST